MTASSFGFFLRGVLIPVDLGSIFSSVAIVSNGFINPPKLQRIYTRRLASLIEFRGKGQTLNDSNRRCPSQFQIGDLLRLVKIGQVSR